MIFLYITNQCNKGCDHCYNPSKPEHMTPETAENSVQWIKNICDAESVKNLRIVFLGGEPLENVNTLFQFVDSVNSKIPDVVPLLPEGQFISFTNGDLFTDEILKGYRDRRIKILFNPTYDSIEEIERKVIYIKSICHGCSLSVALNDVNMPRVDELAKLAVKYHCNMRINRLYDGGNNPDYVEQYRAQMHQVLEILLSSPKPIYPNWIMESTFPTWDGQNNPYSCGRWLVIIDPDGTLRSCNPDYETIIGHINTTKHWSELKFPQRWSAKNLPECQGCEWIGWCQGGCPYTRKLAYGTYDRKSPFCEAFKELFPYLMILKKRWIEGVK